MGYRSQCHQIPSIRLLHNHSGIELLMAEEFRFLGTYRSHIRLSSFPSMLRPRYKAIRAGELSTSTLRTQEAFYRWLSSSLFWNVSKPNTLCIQSSLRCFGKLSTSTLRTQEAFYRWLSSSRYRRDVSRPHLSLLFPLII